MENFYNRPQMNNFITGTTRGLGKALLQRAEKNYLFSNIFGLNRPEYNLNDTEYLDDFVKTDFDFYILNAHYEWSQVELLYKLFEANKDKECHIVVIGSVSADGDRKEVNKYAIQKKALDAAVTQLQLVKSKCLITQIKLGRMNTNMVSHIDAPKMETYQVARQIFDVMEMCSKNAYVKTITIDIKE